MSARPSIDSLDFARNGNEISGEVAVTSLPRLLEELVDSTGVLAYRVRGGMDRQERPYLDVEVRGECRLRCQRCLEAMVHPVAITTRLMLCSQSELAALDDEEEAFDSILADRHLDVMELLEEEILLSLPISPRHEEGSCQAAAGDIVRNGRESPFAALAKLKLDE